MIVNPWCDPGHVHHQYIAIVLANVDNTDIWPGQAPDKPKHDRTTDNHIQQNLVNISCMLHVWGGISAIVELQAASEGQFNQENSECN